VITPGVCGQRSLAWARHKFTSPPVSRVAPIAMKMLANMPSPRANIPLPRDMPK
jgi:hypothetical protein